jgi:hypothetical protein
MKMKGEQLEPHMIDANTHTIYEIGKLVYFAVIADEKFEPGAAAVVVDKQ